MSGCWPGERVGLIFFFFSLLVVLVLLLVFVLVLVLLFVLVLLVLLLYPVLMWPCVVDRTLRSNYYYYSVSCPTSTLWRLWQFQSAWCWVLWCFHNQLQNFDMDHIRILNVNMWSFCMHIHTGGVSFWVQFNVALRPQRPQGLLGTESPGRPPRLSHSSWALTRLLLLLLILLYVHRDRTDC